MLLIIFFCLIAKSTMVFGDCDVESHEMVDFDWSKVGINILKKFL
jgi:hypothetical protein